MRFDEEDDEEDDDDDDEASTSHSGNIFGRGNELVEARDLLDKDPYQIIVVAGANEAGKSRFVKELLRQRRNVTSIQLAQLVDSVSSLTQVFVDKFDLRWLKMRHALIDVLPFAGSEILVMKERFSDRDLEQALRVVTEALKKVEASRCRSTDPKPVIVIDDMGEGDSEWMRSREGELCIQRMLQWCVYVTKERRLAHIILTGNEELVFSLTEHNRKIRGHVKVIGLRPLDSEEAVAFVAQEWPDASPEEVARLTGTFGGWIHDLRGTTREIQSRLARSSADGNRSAVVNDVIQAWLHKRVERITTAFARGERAETDTNLIERINSTVEDDEEQDPFLDPLKSSYSEQANQPSGTSSDDKAGWTPLQLWRTLRCIAGSSDMSVPFATLRDEVFDGNSDPILDLMKEDVLGFEVGGSTDSDASWYVTPASPVLGQAFQIILAHEDLMERFSDMEQEMETQDKIKEVETELIRLRRERLIRDRRKVSLRSTVELGQLLGRDDSACQKLMPVYDNLVAEEAIQEARSRELREKLERLREAEISIPESSCEAKKNGGANELVSSYQKESSIQEELKAAMFSHFAREDPSLSSLNGEDRLHRVEAAFRELDTSKCGELTVDDVARLITNVTGNEVDLNAVESLVKEWDIDNNGLLDYEEFLRMLGMDRKERTKRRPETALKRLPTKGAG
uniref:EF-hand domain-containing protein n=1 Tax=Odontella aurita TaxID=265563 RepID=A0A7S4NHP1_9STRA|mmetsp:Transcript_7976/g.23655  ORF Transcript_7976/g.23655 Transcript_7976/m.23655 type:complete len:684 (+) Transcript_7976:154-2205(+)